MSEDDFEEELDEEEELEEDLEEDLEDDLALDGGAEDDEAAAEGDDEAAAEGEAAAPAARPRKADDDDDVLDLEEELHPDDVEVPLDAILHERTAKTSLDDEEDEDEDFEVDDRGEGSTRIVPRRPGEFLCSSCFLVLPRHQLADEKRMLCRDCA